MGGSWLALLCGCLGPPQEVDPWARSQLEVLQVKGQTVLRPAQGRWINRTLPISDVDGDGVAEFILVDAQGVSCGLTDRAGAFHIVSGRTFQTLVASSREEQVRLTVSGRSEWLVRRNLEATHSTIELRRGFRAGFDDSAHWRMSARQSSVGVTFAANFVGDLDGDGIEDVGVGNAWAQAGYDSPASGFSPDLPVCGAVAVLAGHDGRLIWRRYGEVDRGGLGMDLVGVDDYDGDCVSDVAVLATPPAGAEPAQLRVHTGVNGRELFRIRLPERLFRCLNVGDLDGDRRDELLLGGLVLSLGTRSMIDVAQGWELVWVAEAPTLGSGEADALVVGRRHPETRERRISLYSNGVLSDVRSLDEGEPRWRGAHATIASVLMGTPPGSWSVLLIVGRGGMDSVLGNQLLLLRGP